jgi:hypothetical protein
VFVNKEDAKKFVIIHPHENICQSIMRQAANDTDFVQLPMPAASHSVLITSVLLAFVTST